MRRFALAFGAAQRAHVTPSADMVIVRIGMPGRDRDDSHLPNLLLRGPQ